MTPTPSLPRQVAVLLHPDERAQVERLRKDMGASAAEVVRGMIREALRREDADPLVFLRPAEMVGMQVDALKALLMRVGERSPRLALDLARQAAQELSLFADTQERLTARLERNAPRGDIFG